MSEHLTKLEDRASPGPSEVQSHEAALREAFIEANHKNLDLTEINDAWGKPMFKHSHIQALWDGWKAGARFALSRPVSAPPRSSAAAEGEASFQQRVDPWLMACFGEQIARDILERNHRFLEEAVELVQANGCTQYEAHQLVDYVYGRDQGDINQEVGGVMVTLAALCLASGVDMHQAAETELARVWTKVEKIRAKHFAKPKFSPLPGYATPPHVSNRTSETEAVPDLAREALEQTCRRFVESAVLWIPNEGIVGRNGLNATDTIDLITKRLAAAIAHSGTEKTGSMSSTDWVWS